MLKSSWGDAKPMSRRRYAPSAPPQGRGFRRIDLTVAVPEIALAGSTDFVLKVLEDPGTGAWFGEDPASPGSGLVAISKADVRRPTPKIVAVLNDVAALGRRAFDEVSARADARFERWFHDTAQRVAAALPRPAPDGLAIDLSRVRSGAAPRAAAWRRELGGVRLRIGDDDAPNAWADEWSSTEPMLVADTRESREAVERLGRAVRRGGRLFPPSVVADPGRAIIALDARRIALERLATIGPDLIPAPRHRRRRRGRLGAVRGQGWLEMMIVQDHPPARDPSATEQRWAEAAAALGRGLPLELASMD
jgi:hypothetical protein